MDLKQLAAFLVKAKRATYASEGGEKRSADGSKQLSFKVSSYKYRDTYFGFNPFSGQEMVWIDDEAAWSMNYYGVVAEGVDARAVYAFLKEALKRVETRRPFRGPTHFTEGDFAYHDESKGGLKAFMGAERIFWKGKEVYLLRYHGGLVKKD